MSARVVIWMAGLVFGIALAAWLPETLFPGVRLVAFVAAFFVTGLLGEILERSWNAWESEADAFPRDQRRADGRVEIARVQGVIADANPVDSRFRRFRALATTLAPNERIERNRKFDRGRCPPLVGRVVVLSVFIGRDRRPWADSEIADSHAALLRAGEWLEREASRWSAAVNIEVADTFFVADDDEPEEIAVGFQPEGEEFGAFEQRAVEKSLAAMTRAAIALGFEDALDLVAAVEARIEADTVVWLLHPRRAGRSFAVPRDVSIAHGVSLAVCYPDFSWFPEALAGPAAADAVTVVHELFHLFGASDKYNRSLRTFQPGTVTSREVMRLSVERLSQLRVDAGTAQEVGWTSPV